MNFIRSEIVVLAEVGGDGGQNDTQLSTFVAADFSETLASYQPGSIGRVEGGDARL